MARKSRTIFIAYPFCGDMMDIGEPLSITYDWRNDDAREKSD
jgi:hypothetical protein